MKNNTTTIDLSAMTPDAIVQMLNEEQDLNKHAPLLKALDENLKAENKETLTAAIKTFADCAHADPDKFWTEFVQSSFATLRKLSVDENAEERYNLKPVQRRILFTQIDKAYAENFNGETIANAKNYVRMIARLTDNLHRAECANLSEETGKDCAVIRATYHGEGGEEMKEVDFSGTSVNKLTAQIQAIVDTIMPKGQSVRIVKADTRYIQDVFTSGKEGTIRTGNEKAVEAAIWVAVRKRKNGEAYEVRSMAKCHKEPKAKKSERTEKQEEVMSKVPERPEAAATLSKKKSVA